MKINSDKYIENFSSSTIQNLAQMDNIYLASKIDHLDQIQEILDKGIKLVIDLKTSGEVDFDAKMEFNKRGIQYVQIPVSNLEDLNSQRLREIDILLGDGQQPSLVYCMSGNRVGAWLALHLKKFNKLENIEIMNLVTKLGLTKEPLIKAVKNKIEEMETLYKNIDE